MGIIVTRSEKKTFQNESHSPSSLMPRPVSFSSAKFALQQQTKKFIIIIIILTHVKRRNIKSNAERLQ